MRGTCWCDEETVALPGSIVTIRDNSARTSPQEFTCLVSRVTGHLLLAGFHLSGFGVTQACGILPFICVISEYQMRA